MKILFFCGSLEPGRDGVGDYVRRLSFELRKAGVEIRMLALNDKFVGGTVMEQQKGIPAYRFPQTMSWSAKSSRAVACIKDFQPDWISLQYVPYAFQKKGIPIGLLRNICKITCGFKLHLFFHELWIGLTEKSKFSHRMIGYIQRCLVGILCWIIRPNLIDTSNDFYQGLLASIGVKATVVPLLSNIPVFPRSGWTREKLRELGFDMCNRENYLIFGFFGTVHTEFKPVQTIKEFLKRCNIQKESANVIVLLGIGSSGKLESTISSQVHHEKEIKINYHHWGRQSEENISDFLQEIDYGIPTMNDKFFGKSGTVAAMKLHGVSIIYHTNVSYLKILSTEKLENQSISKVSECFLEKLQNNKNGNV